MNKTERGAALRKLISEKSLTFAGFVMTDATGELLPKSANKICVALTKAGLLHKPKKRCWSVHYFATAEAAEAWQAAIPVKTKLASPWRIPTPQRATAPKRITEKPAHKERVPVQKKAVEIIYPAGYKHSYHPMPPARNAVHSMTFFHDGMGAM